MRRETNERIGRDEGGDADDDARTFPVDEGRLFRRDDGY